MLFQNIYFSPSLIVSTIGIPIVQESNYAEFYNWTSTIGIRTIGIITLTLATTLTLIFGQSKIQLCRIPPCTLAHNKQITLQSTIHD